MIKIYEALGAVADGRVEMGDKERPSPEGKDSPCRAKVYSSSRKKFYHVIYDPAASAIMTNDNGSYWQGYLGYPAIAYLLMIGVLPYDSARTELLKGIAWKEINQKFKNDFDKTLTHILTSLTTEEKSVLERYVVSLQSAIQKLDLDLLGSKVKPPADD